MHKLIEQLVLWNNTGDVRLLATAREEIRKSNGGELPVVLDPFAGGGSIPLEAQRLGLQSHASDLNPLSVLINKALIEIPPRFSDRPPVFPGAARTRNGWSGADGLAEDIRQYGDWMREEAFDRIGHLYPTAIGPDGTEREVIAWIWARTVRSPNPANPVDVPLVGSWWLGKKKGKEAWIHAEVEGNEVRYEVRHDADGPSGVSDGTRRGRGAVSLADGTPISADYIKAEGSAGRMGAHLMAIVAEGNRGRLYLSPTSAHVSVADVAEPADVPTQELPYDPRNIWTPPYGLTKFADLFTNRQLVALTTLNELVQEARTRVLGDAKASGEQSGPGLQESGTGAEAYADAVATYLALGASRILDRHSSVATWDNSTTKEQVRGVFPRQAIAMAWTYAEGNPFAKSSGSLLDTFDFVAKVIERVPSQPPGVAEQADAATRDYAGMVISTDPPYYDMIGYSDLSDYFYVWLRRSLTGVHTKTVGTMLTPKAEELVANPYRHDGKVGAEAFFIDNFNEVFTRIRDAAVPTSPPMTLYYAYKQQDAQAGQTATAAAGWYTLLEGLTSSGWTITATWPITTELKNRSKAQTTNSLASSIVLACRPRPADAPATTRRAFVAALKSELPDALRTLMQGTIAPVDLAQALESCPRAAASSLREDVHFPLGRASARGSLAATAESRP